MSKIKNVIFDIGNVLVSFDWENHLKNTCGNLGDKALQKINLAAWGDGRWDKLDLGEDPEKVVGNMVAYAPEYEKEIRLLFANLGNTLSKRDTSISWIKDLKSRGYKVFYLSNYSHYAMESNRECLDFLPFMDGGVFSCEVHLVKPDRRIYEALAEKYNLIPEECVFIDDLEDNIKAARDFGFKAIQYLSVKQAQEDLNKILED